MIPADKMVSVPAQLLQDLIWNAELACAGMGRGEEISAQQCRALQTYIDQEIPTKDEPEIVLTTGNVTFANFGRKS